MWHLIQHWLGLDSASGTAYLAWSGVLSDLGEITLIGAIAAAFIAWYRRNNCHVGKCRRISHRQVSGLDGHGQPVTYHVCRRHNPAPPPTAGDVHRAHHAARRQARHQDPAASGERMSTEGDSPGCASPPAEQVRARNAADEITDTQSREEAP